MFPFFWLRVFTAIRFFSFQSFFLALIALTLSSEKERHYSCSSYKQSCPLCSSNKEPNLFLEFCQYISKQPFKGYSTAIKGKWFNKWNATASTKTSKKCIYRTLAYGKKMNIYTRGSSEGKKAYQQNEALSRIAFLPFESKFNRFISLKMWCYSRLEKKKWFEEASAFPFLLVILNGWSPFNVEEIFFVILLRRIFLDIFLWWKSGIFIIF